MFKRASLLVVLASLAGLDLLFLVGAAPAATGIPGGFEDQPVVDAGLPTALAFTPQPDNRLLVTGKDGQLWVHEEGATGTTKALDISDRVCSGDTERGLLGVAADPNFATNGFVYLYYTYNKSDACPKKEPKNPDNPVNKVSRFTMEKDGVVAGSEKVLVDNIPSHNSTHNGGDVQFGRDGKLYASVGDGGCDYAEPRNCQYEDDASRDKNVLLGKILRVNPEDGSIPADNPYADAPNGVRCGTLKNEKAGGGAASPPRARSARRPSRAASGTLSAWPSTPTRPRRPSASTTSAAPGERRSTRAGQAPTTAGTSARAATTTASARARPSAPRLPSHRPSTSTSTPRPGAPRSPAAPSSRRPHPGPTSTTTTFSGTLSAARSSTSGPAPRAGTKPRQGQRSPPGWELGRAPSP